MHAIPVVENGNPPQHLIVTIRDVTAEVLQQQKLAAIHQAGIELADLKPDEVVEHVGRGADRAAQVEHPALHARICCNYDVVEIRMLDQKTGKLEPLLAVGMTDEAADRDLCAETDGQRRDRLRRRHRQELPLRRHDAKIRSTSKGCRTPAAR